MTTSTRFGRTIALRDEPPASVPNPAVAFVTLGCPKNQVDSEVMLGHLDRAGLVTTGDLARADVAVVNTCAFLQSAIQESIDTLLEVAAYKKTGRLRKLVVAGCLSSRFGEELLQELPEVDAILGPSDVDRITQVIGSLLAGDKGLSATEPDVDRPAGNQAIRVLSTGVVSPYLKISEGCSAACTFCIIPSLRGPGRSRPVEELVEEARRLAAAGARELVLIAQDLTAYGMDLYGAPSLDRLLRALDEVEGIRWIRLMYANPFYWTDALVDSVVTCRKVLPYVDLPIQHVSDRMLRRMGRRTDGATIRGLVDRLRRRMPDVALRTNIITGFPGETEEDVRELLAFLEEARFDKLVAFPYSPEHGTAAVRLPDRVPEEVARERADRVLALQGTISLARNREWIGRDLEVLVEEAPSETRPGRGRSFREAPEVDGCVRVAGTGVRPGRFYTIRIRGADAYDLVGEPAAALPQERGA